MQTCVLIKNYPLQRNENEIRPCNMSYNLDLQVNMKSRNYYYNNGNAYNGEISIRYDLNVSNNIALLALPPNMSLNQY